MEHADEGEDSASIQREQERQTRTRALRSVEQQLKNLRQMRLLDQLTDEEFCGDRQRLSLERAALLKAMNDDNSPGRTIEPLSSFFSFAQLAEKRFVEGDQNQKRTILLNVASNLFVGQRILQIEARKPFQLLLERPKSAAMCAWLDDVRKNLATGSSGC